MQEQFEFTETGKKICYGLMGAGVLGLLIGILLHYDTPDRIWANLLLNNYYFMGISLIGIFFVAVNIIGYGGWYVLYKRVMESMGAFLPVAGVIMLVIVAGTFLHWHGIYHWSHPGVAKHDPIIAGKMPYFQPVFFIGRIVAYFLLWIGLSWMLRKLSLKEGDEGEGLKQYKKSKVYSALFLVVFAVTESTISWDLIMSIDTHWYSTLFGWYNFSSYFVGGIAFLILIVIYLKKSGYLKPVNENHIHDLGKFMFAFSVFWAYLWFSQYMLIWYGNIPEETVYYKERFANFSFLFWFNFAVNFLFPFLVLMTRRSKRKLSTLIVVAFVLLIGHWIDYYLMIMPGAVGETAGIGLMEILMAVGFFGVFAFTTLNALTKVPLLATNNPFFKESLQHHT